jgi:Protein of unknown function (DUF2946)
MDWCRSRSRLGSCIALFALALQLVLAFGHVHLDGVGGHSSTRIEASGGASPAPASNEAPGFADDDCAICALIHLAGMLVPAEAASLPRQGVFRQRRPHAALHFALPASPSTSFAARAPPVA